MNKDNNAIEHPISYLFEYTEDDEQLFYLHERTIRKMGLNFEAWSFLIQLNLLDLQSDVRTPEHQRIVNRCDEAFSAGVSSLAELALQTHDDEIGDNGSTMRRRSPLLNLFPTECSEEEPLTSF